ncbi:MAG: hypothetical protein PHC34_12735, partial [Candidatus Gastranaerophilales bacterium]|nr:hypothetical protein [Candidatus Gastranaerophilales bacterium]
KKKNKMVSPVRFSIPQPIKTIFVPALGVGAVYADMEKHKNDHQKAVALGGAMTAIATCVCLHRWQTGLLTMVGGIAMWIRTRNKKTKGEKAKSVAQDLVWVGSGLAAQKFLSGKLNKAGERQWYLHNCCAFAIGALVAAPLINRFLFGKESKHEFDPFDENLNLDNAQSYPISMDRYGILSNIIRPSNLTGKNNPPSNY